MTNTERQMLGTEAVRALRDKDVRSLIVGLSANDLEGSFLEAGADFFLLKPVPCDSATLQTTLGHILRPEESTTASSSATSLP